MDELLAIVLSVVSQVVSPSRGVYHELAVMRPGLKDTLDTMIALAPLAIIVGIARQIRLLDAIPTPTASAKAPIVVALAVVLIVSISMMPPELRAFIWFEYLFIAALVAKLTFALGNYWLGQWAGRHRAASAVALPLGVVASVLVQHLVGFGAGLAVLVVVLTVYQVVDVLRALGTDELVAGAVGLVGGLGGVSGVDFLLDHSPVESGSIVGTVSTAILTFMFPFVFVLGFMSPYARPRR